MKFRPLVVRRIESLVALVVRRIELQTESLVVQRIELQTESLVVQRIELQTGMYVN
jgi:hypothetical protein